MTVEGRFRVTPPNTLQPTEVAVVRLERWLQNRGYDDEADRVA